MIVNLGYYVHKNGIDPLIYKKAKKSIFYEFSEINIYSVSTKLLTLPVLSEPLEKNRAPNLLQSFLEIKIK